MIWATCEISQHPLLQSCMCPRPRTLRSWRSSMAAGGAVGPGGAPCQQQVCDNMHKVQQHLPCSNPLSLEVAALWCQIPLKFQLWPPLTWNHMGRECGEIDRGKDRGKVSTFIVNQLKVVFKIGEYEIKWFARTFKCSRAENTERCQRVHVQNLLPMW